MIPPPSLAQTADEDSEEQVSRTACYPLPIRFFKNTQSRAGFSEYLALRSEEEKMLSVNKKGETIAVAIHQFFRPDFQSDQNQRISDLRQKWSLRTFEYFRTHTLAEIVDAKNFFTLQGFKDRHDIVTHRTKNNFQHEIRFNGYDTDGYDTDDYDYGDYDYESCDDNSHIDKDKSPIMTHHTKNNLHREIGFNDYDYESSDDDSHVDKDKLSDDDQATTASTTTPPEKPDLLAKLKEFENIFKKKSALDTHASSKLSQFTFHFISYDDALKKELKNLRSSFMRTLDQYVNEIPASNLHKKVDIYRHYKESPIVHMHRRGSLWAIGRTDAEIEIDQKIEALQIKITYQMLRQCN